jgi:gamma-glutamyltranspeptidase/glutathione hydrolase
MSFFSVRVSLLSILVLASVSCSSTQAPKIDESKIRHAKKASLDERAITEASGGHWAVSTQGRASTRAAQRMYAAGGNIIDAAIAASFTISVERPHSTGLGGGGFFLYREGKTGKVHAIDFRERAPTSASAGIFLDEKGKVIPKKSIVGRHAVAVPGLVKGLIEIHERFGSLPLKDVIQPAIELARSGVRVYPALEEAIKEERASLARFPGSARIFLRSKGRPMRQGEVLVQRDLAESLKRIADTKGEDFYSGKIAESIVKSTGGWIKREDLAAYSVKWREPLQARFGKYDVLSMPPPSSGGAHLIQILNLFEEGKTRLFPPHSSDSVHRMATSMQLAFLDRARYMADPDFHRVPTRTLISRKHARSLWKGFEPSKALSADSVSERISVLPEHSETTHLSIMDKEGNAVATTQTINGWFGSAMVAEGTGIVLNNEMDDFSAKPGASNLFGAVGSAANSVAPEKTPLSSMTPTIILEDGVPRLSIGAPGGTRIITCVAQSVINHLMYKMSLYDSINAVRFHQQWRPDELLIEDPGLDEGVEKQLREKGWKTKRGKVRCAVMGVSLENGALKAVSDPRDHGMSAAGS